MEAHLICTDNEDEEFDWVTLIEWWEIKRSMIVKELREEYGNLIADELLKQWELDLSPLDFKY